MNIAELLKKLDQMFEAAPMMRGESPAPEEVDALVKNLSFELPNSYKQFVLRYGGATVGPYSIYGLRAAETMGDDEDSAIEITNRFRAHGWSDLDNALVISSDHSGNPVYMKSTGEVWINDHDFGGPTKVAESFETYLASNCLGLTG